MNMNAGIEVSSDLQNAFKTTRESDTTRWLKLSIHDKDLKLVVAAKGSLTSNFKEDVGGMAKSLQKKEAAYFLLRLEDEKDYILIAHIPQNAKVRNKMIYASTKKAVLTGFDYKFAGSLDTTAISQLTAEGFKFEKKVDSKAEERKKAEAEERKRLEAKKKRATKPVAQDVKDMVVELELEKYMENFRGWELKELFELDLEGADMQEMIPDYM